MVGGGGGVSAALDRFGPQAEGSIVAVADGALVEAAGAVLFVDADDVAGLVVVGGVELDEGVGDSVVDGALGGAAEAVVAGGGLVAVGECFGGDVAGGVVAVVGGAVACGFGEGRQPVEGVVAQRGALVGGGVGVSCPFLLAEEP